jgi:hypothetical protein
MYTARKTQKARAPINLASGSSKPYEVWRLQLSAHAHVPHGRQIAGQQRTMAKATLIGNNLYEPKQPVKLFFTTNASSKRSGLNVRECFSDSDIISAAAIPV